MPFVPIVTAATAAMLECWQRIAEHGKPLDLQREMADLTRAIILRVLFGDIAAAEGCAVAHQALDRALEHASRRLWSPLGWLEVPTSGNRQYRCALRTVDGFRTPVDDNEIGGYRIAANAIVLLSPFMTHRHPGFWEDPERFDPEGFSPERSATRPRFAYGCGSFRTTLQSVTPPL